MAALDVLDKPEEVGLSRQRLARIRTFFEDKYVRPGKLAGMITMVSRRGQVALCECFGMADVAGGVPVRPETVWRIYSMTKPVASVALMTLYEEGAFQLDDPVSRLLPSWADLRVWEDGSADQYRTKHPERPMTIRDLLTHTSGLTYAFWRRHPVDALYRRQAVGAPDRTLEDMVERLAGIPLLFSPGTRWNYGVSTDVVGRLVEVLSGEPLDVYLSRRIFRPLGMIDTGFSVHGGQAGRLAASYGPGPDGRVSLLEAPDASSYLHPPMRLSGGEGLVSTASDYHRFTQMLLNGGILDGTRILGRKTVAFMTANHLPGGVDMAAMGQPLFNGMSYEGIGFGLGFSVMLDPARAQVVGSPGEYAWGGMASTMFFVDPAEELTAMVFTQLIPSSTYPIRREMRALTYQALVD